MGRTTPVSRGGRHGRLLQQAPSKQRGQDGLLRRLLESKRPFWCSVPTRRWLDGGSLQVPKEE